MASVFVSVVAHLQAAWYPYKDRNLYGQGNLNSRQRRYHIYAILIRYNSCRVKSFQATWSFKLDSYQRQCRLTATLSQQ